MKLSASRKSGIVDMLNTMSHLFNSSTASRLEANRGQISGFVDGLSIMGLSVRLSFYVVDGREQVSWEFA